MKLIIDTNLLFSSIAKPSGKISEIILNPKLDLQLVGCYFSYIELFKHKNKLLKASKLEEAELLDVIYQVIRRIQFLNEGIISEETFLEAYQLTHDIDEKDTVFVAMSKHLGIKIWSGDKILVDGLRKKGFEAIILTAELLEILHQN